MTRRPFDDQDTELLADPSAKAAARAVPRLTMTDASGPREIAVDRLLMIGSANRSDVVLADPMVSRIHAELQPRQDGLWLRDLGSRNGTWVDSVRIKEARVDAGSRIHIGSTTLVCSPAVQSTIELSSSDRFGPLLGGSVVMRELFAMLARLAVLDATVLVTGETGTGKEVVARALHEASRRAAGPMIVVDCGALPEDLLESELFGHAKGAFTGAIATREGAFEAASGGTLFLDEIGELPLAMQPKLLRALESRTVRRVGETAHRPIDVRVISATHRDLRRMVNAGEFREDLYFRVAVLPVHLAPLRDRMDDLPQLIEHFQPAQPPEWRREVLRAAVERPWRGNVRELRNFLERAAALGTQSAQAMTGQYHAAPSAGAAPDPALEALRGVFELPFRDFGAAVEREYLRRLLAAHEGNATAAAAAAGVDRTYIYRLIKKHQG